MFVILSQALTMWENENSRGWTVYANQTLFDYECVMIPVVRGTHWTLLVAHTGQQHISIYNSLGPDNNLNQHFLHL